MRLIAVAALAFAAMMLGGLVFVVDQHARFDRASATARAESRQRIEAAHLVTLFWEENEASSVQLSTPSPAHSDAARARIRLFETAARNLVTESPSEKLLIGQALAANRRFIGPVIGKGAHLDALARTFELGELQRAQPGVVGPLQQIERLNADQATRQDAVAQRAARDLLWMEILSGVLAALAGVGFAIVAFWLIGRIEARNAALVQADREKDEFLGTITHELRTPLTSVLGYVDLLLDDDADPITDEQGSFLAVVQRNAERLLRLVNDLLFVARADAKGLDVSLIPTDLVAVVAEAVEARRPAADTLGLDLTVATELEQAWVAADPGRLGQAIDNLLSNAVKFTARGGRIELALSERDGKAALSVSDTGMGMTEAELSRTFERFFRTSGALANGIHGTGLGLAITKAIVDAHHGTITVHSTPGVGTSFAIELPLLEPLGTTRHREPVVLADVAA